jgi:hypothetical protein
MTSLGIVPVIVVAMSQQTSASPRRIHLIAHAAVLNIMLLIVPHYSLFVGYAITRPEPVLTASAVSLTLGQPSAMFNQFFSGYRVIHIRSTQAVHPSPCGRSRSYECQAMVGTVNENGSDVVC